MEIFKLTLQQMLMMFCIMLLGFILRKKSPLPENSGSVMAKLETYVFIPCLTLFNMLSKCTVQTFKEDSPLIIYGVILIAGAIILSYPLSRLFVKKIYNSPDSDYQRILIKHICSPYTKYYKISHKSIITKGKSIFINISLIIAIR